MTSERARTALSMSSALVVAAADLEAEAAVVLGAEAIVVVAEVEKGREVAREAKTPSCPVTGNVQTVA